MKLIKFIVRSVAESTMSARKPTALEKPKILAYPPCEDMGDSFLRPLSAGFYSNLLRLEEKIQRQEFSESTINEIILLYAKCVEYYDCLKDPIKNYFLEKMQNTLVSKEALTILIKAKSEESKEIDFTTLRSYEEVLSEGKSSVCEERRPSLRKNYPMDLMEKVEKMDRYKHLKKSISNRYSFTKKRLERIKKMNLFLELQGQQDSTELNVNSIMKTYDTISRENDEIVASDISAQVENLQSKLEKRRLFNSLKRNQFDPSFLSSSFYSKEFSEGDMKANVKFSTSNSPTALLSKEKEKIEIMPSYEFFQAVQDAQPREFSLRTKKKPSITIEKS